MSTRENLGARYIRWLLAHRRAVTVALLLCTGLAVWSARRIAFRFAFEDFYEYPGNPDVPVMKRYYQDFGDPAGFVVVLVEADDVFQPAVLGWLDAATRALEPAHELARVRSLTNAKAVHGTDGEVTSGLLMPALPRTPEEIEQVRRVAVHSKLLVRRLVSADSTATVILAELARHGGDFGEGAAAIDAVKRALARVPAPAGIEVSVTGAPVVDAEMSAIMIGDQLIFVPLAMLLILVTTFMIFRSAHALLMLSTPVVVALLWTLGVWPSFERPIDMLSSTFPAVLLVYGAVDPIFVMSRFWSLMIHHISPRLPDGQSARTPGTPRDETGVLSGSPGRLRSPEM
jgi:predicted RND superfamily exporter protein